MEQANKNDKRLLGIVRFYNSDRGFGFIDTNGYGIDSPGSEKKTISKELFFCYRDIVSADSLYYDEGRLVTFSYKKSEEQKRDYAKRVRLLRYSKDELLLATKYMGDYSTIDGTIIIQKVAEECLRFRRTPETAKFVIDSLLSLYAKRLEKSDPDDYIFSVFGYGLIFDFLLNPDLKGITRPDKDSLEPILQHLARVSYDFNQPSTFSRIIPALANNSLEDIRDYICSSFDDTEHSYSFLSSIQIEAFNLLFGAIGYSWPVKMRLCLYERKKDTSYLLNDSLIEYWNERLWDFEYYFPDTLSYFVPDEQLNRLSDFIASSPLSGDKLLMVAFVKFSSQECLKRIKDKEVFVNWLPRQNKITISSFLKQINKENLSLLSEEVIEKSIKAIGIDRVSHLIGDDSIDCLPKSLVIKLIAVVSIKSESSEDEVHTYGGYWTWGEGMKNEEYEILTYLNRTYSVNLYVEKSRFPLLSTNLEAFRKEVQSYLDGGISSRFSTRIQDNSYFVLISKQDSPGTDYIRLFTVSELHERLLLTPSKDWNFRG